MCIILIFKIKYHYHRWAERKRNQKCAKFKIFALCVSHKTPKIYVFSSLRFLYFTRLQMTEVFISITFSELLITTTLYFSSPLITLHHHSSLLTIIHHSSPPLLTTHHNSSLFTTTHHSSLLTSTFHHSSPPLTTHHSPSPLTTLGSASLPAICLGVIGSGTEPAKLQPRYTVAEPEPS